MNFKSIEKYKVFTTEKLSLRELYINIHSELMGKASSFLII